MSSPLHKLNDYMSLEANGQLRINQEILQIIPKELISLDKSERKKSSINKNNWIKVQRSQATDFINSAPLDVVKTWAESSVMKCKSVPGLSSNSDVSSGTYEGGFKVWECCRDLVKFVAQNELLTEILEKDSKILELGAGSCLPSISLLLRMIDLNLSSKICFHMHDYNWQVLATLGLLNLYFNVPTSNVENILQKELLSFFAGDWKDFEVPFKYDIIMMSETIYNTDYYESLHNLLDKHLASDGTILIAMKNSYFGCSGDLFSWTEFLAFKNLFQVKNLENTFDNVPRSLMVLTRKL